MSLLLLLTLAQTQDFAPPPPFTPDAATLAAIKAKLDEFTKVAQYKVEPDVLVYLKAAQWIVKHNEWFTKDSGKQTLAVIETGLARAKSSEQLPWRNLKGKPIVRGYRSIVDHSIQPYSVTYPPGFGTDGKKYLVEINLHGRDATLTEVKFIASRDAAKESNPDRVIVDIYGRGNNGYRWAGERDVLDVVQLVADGLSFPAQKPAHLDLRQPILRGFSMGGGGTWCVGLHHPFRFSALQPGAGFTLTRGHAGKFPEQLPDYQERTLRIYDVANCAENLADIPCVAYSGDKDPQIRAARNIETALKGFDWPLKFEHVVAPGLEHKMPPEWKQKVDAKLAQSLPANEKLPSKVRYVTFTTAYPEFGYGRVMGLEKQYEKAVVEVTADDAALHVKTGNVSHLFLQTRPTGLGRTTPAPAKAVVIDGVALPGDPMNYRKANGTWQADTDAQNWKLLRKQPGLQGPIDDAFRSSFYLVPATGRAWNGAVGKQTDAVRTEFARVWDKYLRGDLSQTSRMGTPLLFGDPGSNPEIAALLPKLPIQWTPEKLTVNGVTYDAATHYPVMIYPKPDGNPPLDRYIILNSGHTFGEDAFKGTNVLLYPRLGDWAVMKVTEKGPEVVAAGIFDSNWQFEKK